MVIDVAHTDILVHLPCSFMYIIHGLEVRYHVQEEVEQLRRGRVVREGGGRGGKEGDRECGGGRGGPSVGQARNEIEEGGHEAPMYANIKVVV